MTLAWHYSIVFIAGASFASFMITLADRRGAGRSLRETLSARSSCDSCGIHIPLIGLIPVFGFFLMRGRCGACKTKFTVTHPANELISGLLALAAFYSFGFSIHTCLIAAILVTGITISLYDLRTMYIRGETLIILLLLSVYPVYIRGSYLDSLYGFLLLGGVFLVIMLLFPGSFGGGDLKLAAILGPLLGLSLSVVALEAALITGALTGVVYGMSTGKGLRTRMPFAPFLFIGYCAALFFGQEILILYYGFI